jgi:hypothetical protein
VKIGATLDYDAIKTCGLLEVTPAAIEFFPVNRVRRRAISAVELPMKGAIQEGYGPFELAVPQVYLPHEPTIRGL